MRFQHPLYQYEINGIQFKCEHAFTEQQMRYLIDYTESHQAVMKEDGGYWLAEWLPPGGAPVALWWRPL